VRVVADDFARHTVALCVHYHAIADGEPVPPMRLFALPAAVVEMYGSVFLLASGHALEGLDRDVQAGAAVVSSAVLIDSFQTDARFDHPIPFDYANAPRLPLYDESDGIDFALVRLSPVYVSNLLSQGIAPLRQAQWQSPDDEQFVEYYVVGLPAERQFMDELSHASVALTTLPIEAALAPPEATDTRAPRFVGRIVDMGGIADIDGMSGGPIFGVTADEPAQYRLVAVQGSWLSGSRTVFGCRVDVIRELMRQWVEESAGGDA
jgi:hypothetical protein